MCRVDVEPGAQRNLAALMTLCARRLAELHGVDPDTVTIGPVDFGVEDTAKYTGLSPTRDHA